MEPRPNPSTRRPALRSRPDNAVSPEYQASAALRNAAKRSLQNTTSLGTGQSTVSMKIDTRPQATQPRNLFRSFWIFARVTRPSPRRTRAHHSPAEGIPFAAYTAAEDYEFIN